jgi:hypothetical protein
MRFYSKRHEFYVGIDFVAFLGFACVMDQEGMVLLHRTMPAEQAAERPTSPAVRSRIDSTARHQSVTVYTCLVQSARSIRILESQISRRHGVGIAHAATDNGQARGPLSLCP